MAPGSSVVPLISVLLTTSSACSVVIFPTARPCFATTTSRLASRTGTLWAHERSEQEDVDDSGGLYVSLQLRRSQLASRRETIVRERELVAALAGASSERAARALREHWAGEEGEAAREAMEHATEAGDAAALEIVMGRHPDWAEPMNRLATCRYKDGDVAESVQLFLRVLSMKPWHFGALHGILMSHVMLENTEEADRWEAEGMPRLGDDWEDDRGEWVTRMLSVLDAILAY